MTWTQVAERPLRAIDASRLSDLLRSLGVPSAVAGEAVCEFCGTTISPRNLEVVFPEVLSREVAFVCTDSTCVRRFAIYAQRHGLT